MRVERLVEPLGAVAETVDGQEELLVEAAEHRQRGGDGPGEEHREPDPRQPLVQHAAHRGLGARGPPAASTARMTRSVSTTARNELGSPA